MKKILSLCLFALAIFAFSGCGKINNGGNGNLYIEYIGPGYEIYMVKYVSPNDNAGDYANHRGELLRMETIGGREYYVFQTPKKDLDIYWEHYLPSNWSQSWTNHRQRTNLKANDWAKMMYEKTYGYHCVDGVGEIY